MKIFKLLALSVILSVSISSCIKDKEDKKENKDDEEIVITDPDKEEVPVIVGSWHQVRMIGLEEDNVTEYDIEARIIKLKKAYKAGGLSTEEAAKIKYEYIRLESALESFGNDVYVFEEGFVGRIHYLNGKWADSEMTWEALGGRAFKIDYGGSYHLTYTFRIASNLVSGSYLYRDYDINGPNLKYFVEKRD